jgi:hypothetical protein
LYDGAGVLVPNTITRGSNEASSGVVRSSTRKTVVTTTGATTYTVRGYTPGSATFTNSLGGSSGGVFQKISGFLPLTPKTFTETLTIGATTTAPTKATTRQNDYITLRDDNSGWCDVSFEYSALSSTGAADGSGTYLYTLPAGYQFDSIVNAFDTSTSSLTFARMALIIPGSAAVVGFNTSASTAVIVPYDATRFKLVTLFSMAGTGHQNVSSPNNAYYGLTSNNYVVQGSFRFKKA